MLTYRLTPSSKPIAGLIFLFKYREDPDDDDEDPPETDLWFANQV